MSVIATKRSLSTAEYVYQAQKIVRFIEERLTKYQNKLNKEYRYKHLTKSTFYPVWNAPLFNAQLVYRHLQIANLIRVKDKESFNKRLTHLNQASQNLKLLESAITTLYDLCGSVIKDQFIVLLTQMIDKEYKLINGVKTADRLTYSRYSI